MKASIRNKILVSFGLVVVLWLAFVGFITYSGSQTKAMYHELLTISMSYNDFFVQLEETGQALERCMSTGNQTDSQLFLKAYPKLVQSAEHLYQVYTKGGYDRQLLDLKYMSFSYVEQGVTAVDMLRQREYAKAISALEEARHISQLIGEQYARLYKIITERTLLLKQQAEAKDRNARTINLLLLCACGVICAAIIRSISIRISRPLGKLCDAVHHFSLEGDGTDAFRGLDLSDKGEIGVLSSAFVTMSDKINQQYGLSVRNSELQQTLSEEKLKMLEMERLLKESQLKALQSRINPHFMFNSLNLIAKMAYMENAEQTATLMESLGELMRYNMEKFSKTATIADELANIGDYLTIQQKRFGDRIAFRLEVNGEVERAAVCCLIIQPLVENAILHGVGNYTEGGMVGIRVSRAGERVILSVYDNGVGLEEQAQAEIRLKIQSPEAEMNGSIGLCNVFQRLKLLFGDEARFRLSSIPGVHTEFTFDIPYSEGGEE